LPLQTTNTNKGYNHIYLFHLHYMKYATIRQRRTRHTNSCIAAHCRKVWTFRSNQGGYLGVGRVRRCRRSTTKWTKRWYTSWLWYGVVV